MFSSLILPRAETKPWRPKYDKREVATFVTGWVLREDMDRCQKRTENILYGVMRVSNLPQTMLNCSGVSVRLDVNCFIRVKSKEPKIHVL
jgi:hypothetical protein